MVRLNVHAYPSPIRHETRMFKQTRALSQSGLVDRVLLVGTWEEGLPEHQTLDARRDIWRIRLVTGRLKGKIGRILQILEWQARAWWRLRSERVSLFNAHNLASLPLGVALKMQHGATLVYDTHELEAHRTGWSGVLRFGAAAVERLLTPLIDATFVVSDSIADWYRSHREFAQVHVFRNYPDVERAVVADPTARPLRDTFGIPDDHLLFLYQGVIDEGRCIDLMLDAFTKVDPTKHLVLMGFIGGHDYQAKIDLYTSRFPNIHFHKSVPPQEVLGYTRSADVGFYLIQEASLSYRLTVGNKFYEYLVCGVPVITSDFPDVSRVIDEHGCGWKVETELEPLLETLRSLTPADVSAAKVRAEAVRSRFVWQSEERRMIGVYGRLLQEQPA